MDRDTLQDDLDLILEQSRDDELPGEWDWEPPLGTIAPGREDRGRGPRRPAPRRRGGASDAEDGPRRTDDDEDEEED